jgi:hypothetical protein
VAVSQRNQNYLNYLASNNMNSKAVNRLVL